MEEELESSRRALRFYRVPAFYIGRGCSRVPPFCGSPSPRRTTTVEQLAVTDGRASRRIAARREINIVKICRINANNSRQALSRFAFSLSLSLVLSRQGRKNAAKRRRLNPHGYYFPFYWFLRAPRILHRLPTQIRAHTANVRYTHARMRARACIIYTRVHDAHVARTSFSCAELARCCARGGVTSS